MKTGTVGNDRPIDAKERDVQVAVADLVAYRDALESGQPIPDRTPCYTCLATKAKRVARLALQTLDPNAAAWATMELSREFARQATSAIRDLCGEFESRITDVYPSPVPLKPDQESGDP